VGAPAGSVPSLIALAASPPAPAPVVSAVSAPVHVAYIILIALHVTAAVVGFAGVGLSGVYAGTARHLDRPGAREEATRWFRSPNRAAWGVLAVPFLAVAAVGVGGAPGELGRLWIDGALAIWLGAAVVLLGVVRPAEAELRTLLGPAVPPDGPGATARTDLAIGAAARRLTVGAAACDVAFVAALGLMIWQPA
jgi:hypothetical protein